MRSISAIESSPRLGTGLVLALYLVNIRKINTLFSLLHQVKNVIQVAIKPWRIRNPTDFLRHAQYCSFPPVNLATFQPHRMPITCSFFRRFIDRLVPFLDLYNDLIECRFRVVPGSWGEKFQRQLYNFM
jgi:hypothetical protein